MLRHSTLLCESPPPIYLKGYIKYLPEKSTERPTKILLLSWRPPIHTVIKSKPPPNTLHECILPSSSKTLSNLLVECKYDTYRLIRNIQICRSIMLFSLNLIYLNFSFLNLPPLLATFLGGQPVKNYFVPVCKTILVYAIFSPCLGCSYLTITDTWTKPTKIGQKGYLSSQRFDHIVSHICSSTTDGVFMPLE